MSKYTHTRVIVAALGAPWVIVPYAIILLALYRGITLDWVSIVLIGLVAVSYGYGGMGLVGLPTHIVLRRLRQHSFLAYALGAVVGVSILLVADRVFNPFANGAVFGYASLQPVSILVSVLVPALLVAAAFRRTGGIGREPTA